MNPADRPHPFEPRGFARALEDLELPDPGPPTGRDLLVRIHAVSVNPRDVKSRMATAASVVSCKGFCSNASDWLVETNRRTAQ